jgi:hypothetical protein
MLATLGGMLALLVGLAWLVLPLLATELSRPRDSVWGAVVLLLGLVLVTTAERLTGAPMLAVLCGALVIGRLGGEVVLGRWRQLETEEKRRLVSGERWATSFRQLTASMAGLLQMGRGVVTGLGSWIAERRRSRTTTKRWVRPEAASPPAPAASVAREAEATDAETAEADTTESEAAEVETTEVETTKAETTEAEAAEVESTEVEATKAEIMEAEAGEVEANGAVTGEEPPATESPGVEAPETLVVRDFGEIDRLIAEAVPEGQSAGIESAGTTKGPEVGSDSVAGVAGLEDPDNAAQQVGRIAETDAGAHASPTMSADEADKAAE